MKIRTQNYGFDAEWIWGLEVLDLIGIWNWVTELWGKLIHKARAERALVLLYTPAAERMAVRSLSTFARLYRQSVAGGAVYYHWPTSVPVLETPPGYKPGLWLVHRATRYLNLVETCRQLTAKAGWRIIMTAPAAEWQSAFSEELKCEVITVPEEEAGYSEEKGKEMAGDLLAENRASGSLSPVEQILLEAGALEVAVPLTLLARYAGISPRLLWQNLLASCLSRLLLLTLSEHTDNTQRTQSRQVAFRGRWLADLILDQYFHGRSKTLLFELLAQVQPTVASERHFFLNVFTALQAQHRSTRLRILQERHAILFASAVQQARSCTERRAWSYFTQQPCCRKAESLPTSKAKWRT